MTTNFVAIIVIITLLQMALLGMLWLSIRMERRLDSRSIRNLAVADIAPAQSPVASAYQVGAAAS